MELIIKISDKMFDTFKKHGIMTFDNLDEYDKDMIADAIANGTPYNPTGDCVSREALKEKLQARYDNGEEDFDKGYNIGLEAAIDLIDNAPAVEARPQGEWIPMSTDCRGYSESFKCSICGAYIYPRCLEKELDYNLCPYCGADMGGREE